MKNDADNTIQHNSEDAFDRMLGKELFWQAPPALTEQLLALAQQTAPEQAAVASGPVPQLARPQSWYTVLVTVLTVLAMMVSLGLAWQLYGAVSTEWGLAGWWAELQFLATGWLDQLYRALPIAQSITDVMSIIYAQLHWLLIAVVLWLALDGGSSSQVTYATNE